MKIINHKAFYVKNPETGEFESLQALAGLTDVAQSALDQKLSLSGGTMTGLLTGTRAHFTSTADASGTEQNAVALRLGAANGVHLDLDGNEIIAKTDATTQGTLYVNNLAIRADGGIQGNMTVSGTLTAAKVIGAVYA